MAVSIVVRTGSVRPERHSSGRLLLPCPLPLAADLAGFDLLFIASRPSTRLAGAVQYD